MRRTKLREIALKIIFQKNFGSDLTNSLNYYIDENEIAINDKDREYLNQVIINLEKNLDEIDDYISKSLNEEWSIDRLSLIDLSLLRLVITEVLYLDIPCKVSIDECIELSKRYSDDKSPGFLNAVISDFLNLVDIK